MFTFKTKHFSMLAVAFAVMALGSTAFAQTPTPTTPPMTMFLGEGVTKINMIQFRSVPFNPPEGPGGQNSTWEISDFLQKAKIVTTANGTGANSVHDMASPQLRMGTFGKSSLRGQVLSFEVVAGAIDRNSKLGEINHTGGITLTQGGGPARVSTVTKNNQLVSAKRVTISSLTINLSDGVISGVVTQSDDWAEQHTGAVNGRFDIFTIDNISVSLADLAVATTGARSSRFDTLFVQNLQVKLSVDAATLLGNVFGASLFTAGDHVGWASVFAVGLPPRELPDYRDWVLRY